MTVIQSNVAGLRNKLLKVAEDDHQIEYAPNGDIVLSPSQLSTFRMCPRKWAARYLHGQHEPVQDSAEAGKRMHKILEVYYNHPKHPVPSSESPAGEWALALIAKTGLPLPGPGVEAERKFKFEHNGVWWRGSKDLTYQVDGFHVIRDHKSTSRLNPAWVKSEAELRTDPQSVIYAYEEYLHGKDGIVVKNEWGYVTRTKYPQTELHTVVMPCDDTVRAMNAHTVVGQRMLKLYHDKPALNDLEPTGAQNGGCEAYGGCKVKGCDVSAIDRIEGHQLHMAKKANHGAAAPPKDEPMGSFIENLRAKQAQDAALGATPPAAAATPGVLPPAAAPPPAATAAPLSVRERLAAQAAINPPKFAAVDVNGPEPEPEPAPAPAPAPVPAPISGATAPRRGRGRPRADAAPPAAVTPPPSISLTDTQPELRGVTDTRAPIDTTVPTPAHGEVERLAQLRYERTPAVIDASSDGFVLCVNCAPIGQHVVLFSQYAAIVHAGIKESKGVDLYNLLGYDGNALFQDALRQALEQSPPQGYLVVNAGTNEGRDAMSVLERHATLIIRGF